MVRVPIYTLIASPLSRPFPIRNTQFFISRRKVLQPIHYLDSNDNICSLDSAQIETVSNDKWQISFLSKQIPSSCGQQCDVRITTCDGALANTFCYKMGVLGVYGEENVFSRLI